MHPLINPRYGSITGVVVKGKQLGRTIGFPTANIEPISLSRATIAKGVYGVYVYIEGERYLGVMNVGERPSIDDGNHLTYEVNILDFDEDLYGKELTVKIIFFIRNEKKFPSLAELIKQIKKDVNYAKIRLKNMEINERLTL
jgi:riboflavin kinase/FMN adenylyltransferase